MSPGIAGSGSVFAGGGEMGERIRTFDWSKTALGPIEGWPESLKTAVRICLGSRHPILIWWGKNDFIQLYNDGYIPILGEAKHPRWLGGSAKDSWSEIWHIIAPMVEGVFATGEATWSEDFLYVINRNLPREETYFTFSYSPLPNDAGEATGIFCAVTETTPKVIGERRLRTLRDLGRLVMEARTAEDACKAAAATLANNPADVPFSLVYLLEDQGRSARLMASTGLEPEHPSAPSRIDLTAGSAWPLGRVLTSGATELVLDLSRRFGRMPGGLWPEPSERALILPIPTPGQSKPTGFMVAGLSPRRPTDSDYRSFFELVAGHLATAICSARAYEGERRRAEALSEIDRAKTAFFSNVSHEFRTPLTLMLGPLESLLAKPDGIAPDEKQQLETAHRNSLRLLKLVNSLLDFSRIEAGRAKARYRPTDLARLTVDLASNFQSAMEAGGLQLVVDCPTLSQPVYVDSEMWETIVLNLLSNAFKFTFEGTVTVRLEESAGRAMLTVSDTGVGIPEAELSRIFERFHRVEGASGRTYEGSGIGLALIQELVKLHGGTVAVRSQPGKGSSFTVTLPTGSAHLPKEQIESSSDTDTATIASRAREFTHEAMQWPAERVLTRTAKQGRPRARILVADDNADMREYIAHIAGEQYDITAVSDGLAALRKAREIRPDLVLTDVMMPGLDGFGLLRELRADPALRDILVILISARAGNEARTEGIAAGADDYITKPFNARELTARIQTALDLQRVRREALDALTESRKQLARELEDSKQLQKISGLIIEQQPGRELHYQILDTAMAIMRSQFGSIQMFDAEHNNLCLLGHRNLHPDSAQFWDRVTVASGSVCGAALREGRRIIVPDVNAGTAVEDDQDLHHFRLNGIVAVQTTPLFTREGQLIGMISTHWSEVHMPEERDLRLLDILAREAADHFEQRRIQKALGESERNLQGVANIVPDLLWYSEPDGSTPWYNDRWTEYTGQTRAQAVKSGWMDSIHPEDREASARLYREAVEQDKAFELEHRIRRMDGEYRWFLVRAEPFHDECDQLVRMYGAATDIHEQKTVLEALRESEHRLKQAISIQTVGVLFFNVKGQIRDANDAFLRLTGYTREELRALPNLNLLSPPQYADITAEAAQRLAHAGETPPYEKELIHKDGRHLWGLFASTRLSGQGDESECVKFVVDITERKRAEAALREREAWLAGQHSALEAALAGAPLERSLGVLVSTVTDQLGADTRAAFCIANSENTRLHHVVGLAADHARAIDGFAIGPDSIACGLAAHSGKPEITADVVWEPAWESWRWLGEKFDFRACWSFPVLTAAGTFVGTLAVYNREPREATPRDFELASLVTQTAAIIIARHTDTEERERAEAALRENQAQLAAMFEALPLGIAVITPDGTVTLSNREMHRYLPHGELPSRREQRIDRWRAWDESGQPIPRDQFPSERASRGDRIVPGLEMLFTQDDGKEIWTRVAAVPISNPLDGITGVAAAVIDINELKRATVALRESEERFRLLVDNVQEYALFRTDLGGNVTSWNPGAERLFGYATSELLGQPASRLFTPEDQALGIPRREVASVLAAGRKQDARWQVRKDGTRFWAQWVTEPVHDEAGHLRGVVKVLRDETERRKAEDAIRRSLADKEALLKEVHHRVKNNLQVITSMVNLQARQIDDPRVLALFDETRNRVYSISAIHELLYRSASFAEISLIDYARQLVPELVRFYQLGERVKVEVRGDGSTLEIQRAVPYGLLLNELVSNACKHAFPRGRKGNLEISVNRSGGQIILTVVDDGIGLPGNVNSETTKSLGLKLIHMLASQIGGDVQLVRNTGTRAVVVFPVIMT